MIEFNYKLTSKIQKFIEDSKLKEIKIGCSDSQVIRIEKDNGTYYLKMAKKGMLTREYEALKWLEGKLSVPKVVLFDDSTENEFLITEAISGEMVCSDYYRKNPYSALEIIVSAFKYIYSVDISNCPFDVSIDYKLALVENNVKNNLLSVENINPDTLKKHGNIDGILKYLKDNKFKAEYCFSHGDTSLPNIFAIDNKFSGFIDVGECGIADKWFDLAICEKSIRRNLGEDFVIKFYEKLNIIPDREKIDYYITMMELYL